MLPWIAYVGAPEAARRSPDWPLVRPRPALHDRLPNCELARQGWTLAADWNRCVMIERVADDRALLRELANEYLDTPDLPLRTQRGGWVECLRERLGLRGFDGTPRSAALDA